ncbi:hypothetical protein [Sphingobacterium pedocola]|uniref:Uncharacterized protein n=1 Tax=Sphingobacterium pedocola TaxID=2082722 RepID=A0ABR9TAE2_9SPHI|nr:hypothetical protein [Sphingobacterium pedocola]MBE8722306.1 hypothetical protein [Sphingobacterium pedocola]
MKNIFKNFDKLGIFAFAAAGLFAISWTNLESRLAPQWYQVTVIDEDEPHDEPSNLAIGAALPSGPSGPCSLNNGEMCAIPIDRKDYTGPITTVAQAQDLADEEDIDLGTPVFRTPQS